jgi:hypothetical protein
MTSKAVPVTAKNFARAETDMYFSRTVGEGGFGKFTHLRVPTAIDKQTVIRMNRDTLYSTGIFDLDAGPVTVTLPDTGKRFMSLLTINEDHYNLPVVYAPGSFTFGRQQVGTRYVMVAVRTLANASDPADVKAANALQDQIKVTQAATGKFEVPAWDKASQDKIRESLLVLAANSGFTNEERFGAKEQVDPVAHLLFTAAGWGGNPREAAVYVMGQPKQNGNGVYQLKVRDVPVDGFWSISIYNAKGFFEKNDLDSYSLNNLTAQPDSDGGFTVQFGGCTKQSRNCLVTPPGWSYVVRMYRPRAPVVDGSWTFPEAKLV